MKQKNKAWKIKHEKQKASIQLTDALMIQVYPIQEHINGAPTGRTLWGYTVFGNRGRMRCSALGEAIMAAEDEAAEVLREAIITLDEAMVRPL